MGNMIIPNSVPKYKQKDFRKNWRLATKNTGRLLLFAGDQKIEHLNDDFYGKGISKEDANPEHLFKIASEAHIGVFATHLGLITRYGAKYTKVPYLVKLNGRSNLFTTKNPLSQALNSVEEVVKFKQQNRLNIVGVGYTIYLGSEHEAKMLTEAAKIINQAHQQGLLAVIWMYPRGPKVTNEEDIHLIAGGAGVATTLGADFVKVKYPYKQKNTKVPSDFQEVVTAAGNTGVICVGGSHKTAKDYLAIVDKQIKIAKTRGVAVGRNIHQRPLKEAVHLANALSALVFYDYSYKDALSVMSGKKKLKFK